MTSLASSRERVGSISGIFYLAAQFGVRVTGFATLALFVYFFIRDRLYESKKVLILDYLKLTFSIGLLSVFFFVQSQFLDNSLRITTLLHLALYASMTFAVKCDASPMPPLSLVRIVTIANFFLIFTFFVPGLKDFFWYENVGMYRYRSFYFEPSILAIFCVFNILVLYSSGVRGNFLYLIGNFLSLMVTVSGSGFFLLLLCVFVEIRFKNLVRFGLIFLVAVPLGMIILRYMGFYDSLLEQILGRISGVFETQTDGSAQVRFVASYQYLSVLSGDLRSFFLGSGIGGIQSFMAEHTESLWFFINYDGEFLSEINNGYVVLIAIFGFPIGLFFLIKYISLFLRSDFHKSYRAFAVFYPFFSGFVIHPLFFLLVSSVFSSKSVRDNAYRNR